MARSCRAGYVRVKTQSADCILETRRPRRVFGGRTRRGRRVSMKYPGLTVQFVYDERQRADRRSQNHSLALAATKQTTFSRKCRSARTGDAEELHQ
jgi:hypothetical protein